MFSRNTSVSDIGSEVRREVNAGIATVSRMIERLDTRDSSNRASASSHPQNASTTRNYNSTSGDNSNNNDNILLSSESSTSASCASAGSN